MNTINLEPCGDTWEPQGSTPGSDWWAANAAQAVEDFGFAQPPTGIMESTCGWASEADDTEIESAPSHDPNEDDPLWRVALLHASTRETRCTSCSNLECCRLMVSLTFTADYYEFMAEEVPNEARSHRRRARRLLKARRKFGRSLAANECWPRGVINGRK